MSAIRIWTKLLSFLLSALLALKHSSCSSIVREDETNNKRQTHDDRCEHCKHHALHSGQMAKATAEDHVIECGVYLAPSSIPGSGLGMYAGNRTYVVNDIVTDEDIVIPIFEREWHSNVKGKFLWDEYTWNGDVSFFLVSVVV
jgi:hypothetical protein